jgi:hypothetical protein
MSKFYTYTPAGAKLIAVGSLKEMSRELLSTFLFSLLTYIVIVNGQHAVLSVNNVNEV